MGLHFHPYGPDLVSWREHVSMRNGGHMQETYVTVRDKAWEISCRAARGRRGSRARHVDMSTSVGYVGRAAATGSSSPRTSTTGSSWHGVR
jgi:hypothetical protein